MMASLAEIVRATRAEKGMSLAAFAAATGVSQTTLATLEYGGRVSASTLQKVATYLARPLAELTANEGTSILERAHPTLAKPGSRVR